MQPAQPTREQMAELEDVVALARKIIYSTDVFGSIVEEAEKGQPVDTLASTVVAVITKVESSRKTPMDPTVALGIGIALLGDIADALQQVGLPEFSQEDLAAALQAAVFLWLKQNEGNLDPAQMQRYQGELQQLAGGAR